MFSGRLQCLKRQCLPSTIQHFADKLGVSGSSYALRQTSSNKPALPWNSYDQLVNVRGKKKKAGGVSKNNRDSPGQRLGIKVLPGQFVSANHVIMRQRGTRYHPGENVHMGRDHTIHASVDGEVKFTTVTNDNFERAIGKKYRQYINVVPKQRTAPTTNAFQAALQRQAHAEPASAFQTAIDSQ